MALVQLVMLVTSLVSASEMEDVALVFFRHLAAGRGDEAAALCSEEGLSNVTPMLERLKEGLRSGEASVAQRMESFGYDAGPDEMMDWDEEEYLARTLELPMVSSRYSSYDSAWVCSTSAGADLSTVHVCLLLGADRVLPAQMTMSRERGSWRVVDFMGLYSFP